MRAGRADGHTIGKSHESEDPAANLAPNQQRGAETTGQSGGRSRNCYNAARGHLVRACRK
jgi:hypothetical protein